MESAARQILGKANQAREDGDFEQALIFNDQAVLAFQAEGDLLGLAEAQSYRSLTFRHLYEKTNDKNFLLIGKGAARTGVEIAEGSGSKESLAIPYFNLAKAYDDLGELDEAIENYRKAVENITNNPPAIHNRPTIVADFKVHLATSEYRNGDKSALERAEQALKELEDAETGVDTYNKPVWLSGAHMRIAQMLKEDDPQKAKEHLEKAKEIVDSDKTLTLRKEQLEKLVSTFR